MNSKLTLRLDEDLIRKAKLWADARGISVSQAVADFFAQLPEPEAEPQLAPWVRRLAGIARPAGGLVPTDEEIREDYLSYLEAKYQ